MRIAGPFGPAVLLIGALGAEIWLPAPRGHWKGFGTRGHPAPDPGRGAPAAPSLREKVPSAGGVLGSVSVVMGSRCFSPLPCPHQGSRVLGSQLAVACPNFGGRGRICPVSPISFLQRALGSDPPPCPVPPPAALCPPRASRLAGRLQGGDLGFVPTEFLPTLFPPASITAIPCCSPRGCSIFGFP